MFEIIQRKFSHPVIVWVEARKNGEWRQVTYESDHTCRHEIARELETRFGFDRVDYGSIRTAIHL